MALPVSIYVRKKWGFGTVSVLKPHFYSKCDGSNERLLQLSFIRRLLYSIIYFLNQFPGLHGIFI